MLLKALLSCTTGALGGAAIGTSLVNLLGCYVSRLAIVVFDEGDNDKVELFVLSGQLVIGIVFITMLLYIYTSISMCQHYARPL